MYLHDNTDGKEGDKYYHHEQNGGHQFKCVGCKYSWKERNHVKSHMIQNMEVFFCFNCDDWIQEKAAVFNDGWTMFDEMGALRYDI